MNRFGKLAFCLAASLAIAPAFAYASPQDYHDQDHRDWHDDHHDDHRDWHDDHDHRGPPPRVVEHHWERGHRYDGHVVIVDRWHDYRGLREPPRGYHWVRDDDDHQFLLVAITTGIIADIVAQQ